MAADKFFIYLLLVNLASIAAVSIAFAASAGVRINAVANLIIVVLFVVSMVCLYINCAYGWNKNGGDDFECYIAIIYTHSVESLVYLH